MPPVCVLHPGLVSIDLALQARNVVVVYNRRIDRTGRSRSMTWERFNHSVIVLLHGKASRGSESAEILVEKLV